MTIQTTLGSRSDPSSNAELDAALERFCRCRTGRAEALDAIASATAAMTPAVPALDSVDLVVPVLRAGLSMLPAADIACGFPDVAFAVCRRTAGEVVCTWAPAQASVGAEHVLILDVILATGRTLKRVIGDLVGRAPSPRLISVLVCFATHEGLARAIEGADVEVSATIGRFCEGVDPDGYVIPPTNGDAGDKLFRSARDAIRTPSPLGESAT